MYLHTEALGDTHVAGIQLKQCLQANRDKNKHTHLCAKVLVCLAKICCFVFFNLIHFKKWKKNTLLWHSRNLPSQYLVNPPLADSLKFLL